MQFRDLPRGRPGTHIERGEAARALWLDPHILETAAFWRYAGHKVFLGATESGVPVGVADNRHLVTVAGSRAGKGVSAILPNLLRYEGSVLVLDPKGENASKSAERRGKGNGIPEGGLGHEVYVIDPFRYADVDEGYRAGFNPLKGLKHDAPEFIDDCDAIADAMIVAEAGRENDFWNTAARIVLRGFVAWVAAEPQIPKGMRNLVMVRRLLIKPRAEFRDFLEAMADHIEVASGVPREAALFLLGLEERERSSVMSTVLSNIAFLASPPMRKVFEGGERQLSAREWKFGGKSVYLCLPAMRLHRHSRFLRLYVTSLLLAVEADRSEPEIPALMILDEMHVLGRMEALQTAAGLVAGYGLRIWSIWQDFSQLKDIYADRWETFLGNASILQVFGLNDMTTLKYVSERLGTSPTMQVSQSEISTEDAASGFTGKSKSLQAGPLLSPEEIAYFFSRQSLNQVISFPGSDPIFLKRVNYLMSPFFDAYRRPDDRFEERAL